MPVFLSDACTARVRWRDLDLQGLTSRHPNMLRIRQFWHVPFLPAQMPSLVRDMLRNVLCLGHLGWQNAAASFGDMCQTQSLPQAPAETVEPWRQAGRKATQVLGKTVVGRKATLLTNYLIYLATKTEIYSISYQ